MSIPLRAHRVPLALTTGFLVLAVLIAGIFSASARGVAARGVSPSTPALDNDLAQVVPGDTNPHDLYNWGGNEVYGPTQTYGVVSVEFRIPTLTDPPSTKGDTVALWAGLGGDPNHAAGGAAQLVQAGIISYIDSSGTQYNYAFYEYVGPSSQPQDTIKPAHIHFNNGLNAGDKIDVTVVSNYEGVRKTQISITDERGTGETEHPTATELAVIPMTDGATGECIAERMSPTPLAEYNPAGSPPDQEWLNDCVVTNNNATTHPVGPGNGWANTDWYRIIGKTGDLVEGIGACDSNGSTPLNWVSRY
ncbi:MAG: G1 family glutamic endopeptidase [Ktedonobacterales bacterium]